MDGKMIAAVQITTKIPFWQPVSKRQAESRHPRVKRRSRGQACVGMERKDFHFSRCHWQVAWTILTPFRIRRTGLRMGW